MNRREFLAAGTLGTLAALRWNPVQMFGEAVAADSFPAFGAPPPLAGLLFPEPRVYLETQGWWVQGRTNLAVPAADFPFTSTHVHLGIPFPMGERVVIPASGGYEWPYYAQFHNGSGGLVRQVRGGAWQLSSCCPKDPGYLSSPITTTDQNHVGSNFTFKDSNIGSGTGFRASELQATCAPGTVSLTYALAEGTSLAFLYIDPNLHAGSKGTVVAENKTGSSGTFTFSTAGLAPGVHVALGGAWEKSATGWNAGVARLPFRVC